MAATDNAILSSILQYQHKIAAYPNDLLTSINNQRIGHDVRSSQAIFYQLAYQTLL